MVSLSYPHDVTAIIAREHHVAVDQREDHRSLYDVEAQSSKGRLVLWVEGPRLSYGHLTDAAFRVFDNDLSDTLIVGEVNEVLEDATVEFECFVIAGKVEVQMPGSEGHGPERRVFFVRVEQLSVLEVLVDQWDFVDEEQRWRFLKELIPRVADAKQTRHYTGGSAFHPVQEAQSAIVNTTCMVFPTPRITYRRLITL